MINGRYTTGIDIRADSVQIAQIASSPSGPRIAAACSAPIPPGSDSHERRAAAALRSLIKEKRLRVARAAVVLPGARLLFRNTMLPASEPAELAAMASLDMEYHSTIPSSELSVRHFVIEADQPGGSRVIITAARKQSVLSAAEVLRIAGIQPSAVIPECFAASSFFATSAPENGAVTVIQGDAPGASLTTITSGGPAAMNFVPAQLDGIKAEGIAAALRYAGDYSGDTPEPDRILLFGNTSALPGPEQIHTSTGIPVEISDGGENISIGDFNNAQMAAGAALAMLSGEGECVSLLRENDNGAARTAMSKLATRIAIAAAVLILILPSILGASSIKARKAELRKANAKLATLKPRLAEMAKKEKTLSALSTSSTGEAGCLDIMAELSRVLPAGVFVTSLAYESGNGITITAETASQKDVARAIRVLEDSALLSDILLSYSREAEVPGGSIVTFEIKSSLTKESRK